MDVIGEASNSDKQPVVAISYGTGTNKYTIDNAQGFVSPQMVERLSEFVKPPEKGPAELIEEVT